MLLKFSKVQLIILLAEIIENHPAFKDVTDELGQITIPMEKYGEFAYDMGLVLGRILDSIAQQEE